MANVASMTASLRFETSQFDSGVARAQRSLRNLQGTATATEKSLSSMASGFIGGMGAGLATKAMEIAATAASMAWSKLNEQLAKGFELASQWKKESINLEVLLGDPSKAAALTSQLSEFAASSTFTKLQAMQAAQGLLGFGIDESKLTTVMKQIGDIALGDEEKFKRLAIAYGQITSKGKLFTEELNQIAEAGVNLRPVLANQLGIGVDELSKKMQLGKVSAAEFESAFATLAETKFGDAMAKQADTASAKIAKLKNNIDELSASFAEGMVLTSGAGGVLEYVKAKTGSTSNMDLGNKAGLVAGETLKRFGDSVTNFVIDGLLQNVDPLGIGRDAARVTGADESYRDIVSKTWNRMAAEGDLIAEQNKARRKQEAADAALAAKREADAQRLAQKAIADRVGKPIADMVDGIANRITSLFPGKDMAVGRHGRKRGFAGAVSAFFDPMIDSAGERAAQDAGDPTRRTSAMRVGSAEAFSEIIRQQFGGRKAEEDRKAAEAALETAANTAAMLQLLKDGATNAASVIDSFRRN